MIHKKRNWSGLVLRKYYDQKHCYKSNYTVYNKILGKNYLGSYYQFLIRFPVSRWLDVNEGDGMIDIELLPYQKPKNGIIFSYKKTLNTL